MKNILSKIAVVMIITFPLSMFGQGINYQAALRNVDGTIMAETNVNLGVSINDEGSSVYTETISVTSDKYGLINAQIGVNSAAFDDIDWSSGNHTLAVSIDGVSLGEVPFSVVPYSKTSTSMTMENLINVFVEGAQNGDILIYDDGEWYSGPPSDVGTQSLTLNGTTLTISGSNSVNLSEIVTGGDGWGAQSTETTNRISGDGTSGNPLDLAQQGANNGQVLKWSNNSWQPSNDIDTDTDDQTLAISGSTLTISGGNSVDLSDVAGGDDWGQQNVVGDGTLKGNGTASSPLGLASQNAGGGQVLKWNGVEWSPSDDADSDGQTLSLNGNLLSISGGNEIMLPASGSGDITGVNAGTGITGGGTSGEVTISALNSAALWNANQIQGFEVSDNTPNSGQALIYTGAEWQPSAIISQVSAGTGLTGGGSSGAVTVSAQTETALWNAKKIQGKEVEISNPEFGQVLAYDSNTDKFINAFQLDADFVPLAYGGTNTLSALAPVVSNNFSDVNLAGVSGNVISGNPVGSQIAMDGNEIMAKLAEDVPGHLYLQNEGGQVSVGAFGGGASHILHVFGVARSTSSTWATSSDRRVKKDIKSLDKALDKIMNLKAVSFNWNQDYKTANRNLTNGKIGFIAQQVETVVPEMVSTIEEKYGDKTIEDFKVLNMDPLFPLLVKSIQEQQEIIDSQQDQIDDLKQLVNSLLTEVKTSSVPVENK